MIVRGTVRIAQAAFNHWAMAVRVFLILSVVAASPVIVGFAVGSHALLKFMS